MNSRTLQNPTLNFRLCLTLIAVWSCVFLSNNVYGQCWMHTPTEYGKNLEEHMIKDPVHRWYNTEMDFRVQNTVRYWYGGDIAIAKSQWNNSSYKGVSTSFDFNDLGNTNAPSDYSDLNNVIGILHLPSDIAAQAHTWWYEFGDVHEIYECDININSIAVLRVQPHHLAGPNDLCVANSLTHEFGHALGLSHMDQHVEYIPDTMYYDIEYGEHKKEDLMCDDQWGIWHTYDSGDVPLPAPSAVDLSQLTSEKMPPALEDGDIPSVTELIGNYPNPFNPETWIPYRLASHADVNISIYDSIGGLVRTLEVGHKPKGNYVNQAKAVHWDGTDNNGVVVASGVYFYTMTADDFSQTKRLVILK